MTNDMSSPRLTLVAQTPAMPASRDLNFASVSQTQLSLASSEIHSLQNYNTTTQDDSCSGSFLNFSPTNVDELKSLI